MTSKNNQGQINRPRRQWLYRATAGLGMAGLVSFPVLAAKSSAVSPASKPEKRSITLATTSIAAMPYLPLLVAQHKGFFAQQGIEVQISEQQSAARAMAALASGGADLFCGWLENVFSAQARALALQSFVLLGQAPMMAVGVSTRSGLSAPASSALPDLAKLRGRKIGVVALNSPTHTIALSALRRARLQDTDVGWVSVGSPASAHAALRSGQIDALVHLDPFMLQLQERGEIIILADMRSPLTAFQVLGMHVPSSCVAAPQDFLQNFPGTAQACSDGLVQALRWLAQASLKDLLQLQQNYASVAAENTQAIDAQSFVASYQRLRLAYSADGMCSPQMASDLWRIMQEAEPALQLEKLDVMRSINNALVKSSLAKLKS
jgi:NitT/TauT family transport system substrate-binding protein